jgi:hypothetical protein
MFIPWTEHPCRRAGNCPSSGRVEGQCCGMSAFSTHSRMLPHLSWRGNGPQACTRSVDLPLRRAHPKLYPREHPSGNLFQIPRSFCTSAESALFHGVLIECVLGRHTHRGYVCFYDAHTQGPVRWRRCFQNQADVAAPGC